MWDPNDCIKTWLWSHGCASDTQIRTASQKSYSERGSSSVEILVCSLYSNYLVQSSFLFGVGTAGTAFPHLFFIITSAPLEKPYQKEKKLLANAACCRSIPFDVN